MQYLLKALPALEDHLIHELACALAALPDVIEFKRICGSDRIGVLEVSRAHDEQEGNDHFYLISRQLPAPMVWMSGLMRWMFEPQCETCGKYEFSEQPFTECGECAAAADAETERFNTTHNKANL